MTEFKVTRPKPKSGPKAYTTTLAISGLGAKKEDIEAARAAGLNVPLHTRRATILLYGPPGTGKTVNAHQMPRTRTLDLDNGMQSVEWAIRKGIIKKDPSEIVFKTILPPPGDAKSTFVIDECADTVDEWIADEDIPPEEWDRPYPQFWDTLIIDGGTALTDSSIILGLKENNRLDLSKSWERMKSGLGVTPMRMQDWGSAGSLFYKFITQMRSLGKNVVLICHEHIETDDDTGTVLGIKPLLIGQLRDRLPKDFSEVWYCYVEGSRNDPKFRFQTTPDPLRRLRSRSGCLDPVEEADFAKIRKKIASFYGVPEEELWVAYHGSEGRNRAIEEQTNEEQSAI